MLLLLLVLLTALATGYYQRAKIFTMDRGRPSFARGYCGGQIIWSAAHTVLRPTSYRSSPPLACLSAGRLWSYRGFVSQPRATFLPGQWFGYDWFLLAERDLTVWRSCASLARRWSSKPILVFIIGMFFSANKLARKCKKDIRRSMQILVRHWGVPCWLDMARERCRVGLAFRVSFTQL